MASATSEATPEREPPSATRWGRVVAANVVGVVLLLAVLEAGVRVARPDIAAAGSDGRLFQDAAFTDADGVTTGLRPGATGRANGEAVRVDADGFHAYRGNDGVADGVWLWLGDSVTFGVGVAADSTVAGRLAAAQDTARVLNPSVLGWGTADYRRRLDAALSDGLRPDRVTLVWCLNDAAPGRPPRVGELPTAELWKRRVVKRLNLYSRLYRLAKDAALDRPARYLAHDRAPYLALADDPGGTDAVRSDGVADDSVAGGLDAVADDPGGPVADAPIDRALAPLWAIRDTLAARGIPFEVVVAPYEPQLRPGGDGLPQRVLIPELRRRGIRTLDLLDAFRADGGAPSDLYLWSDGIHLSATGHALAAREIAAWHRRRRPG